LGLRAYHIVEVKDEINPDVYEEQIAMMEMVLDVDAIITEVATYRGG
jgi:betaine reductase